jgi:hypothetical protein
METGVGVVRRRGGLCKFEEVRGAVEMEHGRGAVCYGTYLPYPTLPTSSTRRDETRRDETRRDETN